MQRNDIWWDVIDVYQNRLRSIDIFVAADRLSRKLHQYLSKRKRIRDKHSGVVEELTFPSLTAPDWEFRFVQDNESWVEKRDLIRWNLESTLSESYSELHTVSCDVQKKKLTTRIAFCANRLPRLGLSGVESLLTAMLIDQPTILRQPGYILSSLADQGFSDSIGRMLSHYSNSDFPSAPYYLALTIESASFLPEMAQSILESIANIAVDRERPAIVRLKATETLILSARSNAGLHCERIHEMIELETSPRILKNYILLHEKYNCSLDLNPDNTDFLVQTALRFVDQGETDKLYDYVEPDILRKRYYGWEYPDDSREYTEFAYY